jgi:acyl-CoA thioesterase I
MRRRDVWVEVDKLWHSNLGSCVSSRVARSFGTPVCTGLALFLLAASTAAQSPLDHAQPQPPDALDINLSPECQVPASKLYTLAPLAAVRAVFEEKRPIKVLALGPSAATYPARLEEELEKVLSGIDVDMEQRSLPGDILADAFDRFYGSPN